MALDREDTLKKAEKLLRQGRLAGAIAEYVRVVEDQPRDWNTANTLGDLYQRAGEADKAIAQYTRIAEHFVEDGFYPKAAALFKKILKLNQDDELSQLRLAELSARQGLLRDARTYFNAVAVKRRASGNPRGADEIIVRLGDLDPADIDARLAAARVLADGGDDALAAGKYRQIYADLVEKGRNGEALEALRQAVRSDPTDTEGRQLLAKMAAAAGDLELARGYLDRDSAGGDPGLLMALADLEVRSGRLDVARDVLSELLGLDPGQRGQVIELAWELCGESTDAAFVCVDCAVNASVAASEFAEAAAMLHEFVTRAPGHIPAMLKQVEVCVDGGLETKMYEAQSQLADAYLASGQAADARAIAEDLVAREPWEEAHIDRFRRALVMLRVSEPDTVIAERLSGQSPFVATGHFENQPLPDVPVRTPSAPPPPAEAAPVPRTAAPKASAAKKKAKHDVSSEIDLTSALGDLESEPTTATTEDRPESRESLDDAFAGTRGASRKGGTPDQSAQHMKLAETYLEMGLIDEAVVSLKIAVRSPRHRFGAGVLLGRLFRERGDADRAIEWLERAAEATPPSADEGRALLYDLGDLLESVGETARALGVFMELQSDAGEYRDVPSRIDHLSRAQSGG